MPYPPWVMEHKKKGMYVNRINESTYRIYRAHSERIKGTGKVRRVVDEYIGTITEKGGLVPTQPKIKGEVRTVRYGGYAILWCGFAAPRLRGFSSAWGRMGRLWLPLPSCMHCMGDDSPFSMDVTGRVLPIRVLRFLQGLLASEARRVARGLLSTLGSALGDAAAIWRPRPSSAGSG